MINFNAILKMVKISNLFLATAIFMTAVLGLYGTKPILKTSTKPKPKGVEMVLKRVQLRGNVVDLTEVASRTRTVSAPLKSRGGVVELP